MRAITGIEVTAAAMPSTRRSEISWRAGRRMRTSKPAASAGDPAAELRVAALLARAAAGRPDAEARTALAELALIAPDDARVVGLMKARGAGAR